jgi:hypothetical protein
MRMGPGDSYSAVGTPANGRSAFDGPIEDLYVTDRTFRSTVQPRRDARSLTKCRAKTGFGYKIWKLFGKAPARSEKRYRSIIFDRPNRHASPCGLGLACKIQMSSPTWPANVERQKGGVAFGRLPFHFQVHPRVLGLTTGVTPYCRTQLDKGRPEKRGANASLRRWRSSIATASPPRRC